MLEAEKSTSPHPNRAQIRAKALCGTRDGSQEGTAAAVGAMATRADGKPKGWCNQELDIFQRFVNSGTKQSWCKVVTMS